MIIKDIDIKKTKDNAKKVLLEYRRFNAISKEEYESKVTVTYSFEPKSFTGLKNNPIEDHVVRKETAQKVCDEIYKTIMLLPKEEHREILLEKYCGNNYSTDKNLMVKINISSNGFYKRLENALIEFSKIYRSGKFLVYEGGITVDEYMAMLL